MPELFKVEDLRRLERLLPDDAATAAALAEKTAGLRIMADDESSEISCTDLGAPVLVVSHELRLMNAARTSFPDSDTA